jgi:hypothetical protein
LGDETLDDAKEEKFDLLFDEGTTTFQSIKIIRELIILLSQTA